VILCGLSDTRPYPLTLTEAHLCPYLGLGGPVWGCRDGFTEAWVIVPGAIDQVAHWPADHGVGRARGEEVSRGADRALSAEPGVVITGGQDDRHPVVDGREERVRLSRHNREGVERRLTLIGLPALPQARHGEGRLVSEADMIGLLGL